MIPLKRSLLMTALAAVPMFAQAQVASINLAKFDDQETVTVFFDDPQVFKQDQLQKLFVVEKYDYEDWTRKPDTKGQWHLSKDGYRLSYYPIGAGDYLVKSGSFKDNGGNEYREYVYVGEASSSVKIMGRGPVMPIAQGALSIEMMGTEEVDIEFFKLDHLPQFLERFYIGSNISQWDLSRYVKDMTPAGIFRYRAPSHIDTTKKTLHNIPVDQNITSGAYIVTVNAAGEISRNLDTRILFITDMGLHARLYPNETVIVGNQFSTGAPIDGATVEVWRNDQGKVAITEDLCWFKEGVCRIPQKLTRDDIVVAKKGSDVSILPLKEIALDLNDYAVDGAPYSDQVAYVYSNRELYRPGETMPMNILLRNQDGQMLPKQPINIRLINPEHKVVYDNTVESIEAGFYQTHLSTSAADKTGRYRVEVRTDAASEKPNGVLNLFIEEFMPERMALTLSGVKDQYDLRDDVMLGMDSHYLFGAPASHNGVKIQGDLRVNRTPFKGHSDWYVGTIDFPFNAVTDQITYDSTLNAEGQGEQRLSLGVESGLPAVSAVLGLAANVTVLDGQTSGITRSFKTDFWPTNVVPVIRPLFGKNELGYGSEATFEIFTAKQNQQYGTGDLKLTLKYKDSACTWVYNPNSGWDCHENYNYQIREQKVVKAAGKPITYQVNPNSWGNYILEVEDLSSRMVTQYPFSAEWSSTSSGQLPAVKPNALALSTDKAAYQTGETITLTIDAPLDGNLTLMLEGGQLLYTQNLNVKKGKTTVKVPLNADWNRHDLYLSGLLLSTTKQKEVVRSLGLIPIHLNRADRLLSPKVSATTVALPDRPTTIKISVPNADQESLYATVSITDQGILNMIPERAMSIFDAFFAHQKYGVDIIDYYNRLFKRGAYALLVPKFGGDGQASAEDGLSIDNMTEMKTVSLMSELIALDDNGQGEVTLLLPDFNGEAQVEVKVFSNNRMGEQQEKMIIRAPIVADIVTPRFIRVGDESNVSLSLHNLSGEKDDVKIHVTSPELALDFTERVTLKDGESRQHLIPISLPEYTQGADIALSIDAKSYQAERNYRLGTDPITERTTQYQRELLPKGQTWVRNAALTDPFDRNYQERLTLSRHPQVNVLSYTDGLFSYPYGCTEQTTSAAFPWLFKSNPLLDGQKEQVYRNYEASHQAANGPRLEYAAWEKEMLRDVVKQLVDRQREDGGFSFWTAGESYFPTSVYALDFLTQLAKQDPSLVSPTVVDQGLRYVKQRLTETYQASNNEGAYLLGESELNNLSYGVWLLAREGKIFSADIAFLESYTATLSPLSRVYLAGANLMLSHPTAARNYMNHLDFMGWQRDFGAYQTRVSALANAINVLNELTVKGLFTDVAKTQQLNVDLNNALNQKQYFSTQERYALIKVGIDTIEDTVPLSVLINGQADEVTPDEPINANHIAKLTAEEPLFLEYEISGYPSKVLDARNFNVDFAKDYVTGDAQALSVGERFVVYVTLKSEKNLPNALLADFVPTGFVLVNPNLVTDNVDEFYEQYNATNLTRNVLTHEEYRFDRYVAAFDMKAGETYRFAYVLEAQVPGDYQVPITLLEDMYIPELRNIMVTKGRYHIEAKP
ncbi:alpha-2-macroglobulin family protein [Wohlfahrtiimonas chitiniclastica]|uniref:alpha-2-macroglobulin family protein n=1 Tax=Wohlfahrtiimonas chitiniclastica TaxID=400946 RepID=UPI0021570349|nr:MG2 domain-containing protein [Wohlfahrtiimonas chitiniclastica]MDC7252680.1 hypothetical protein [Wohlfahrtiimonas chitiniclastica]